MVKSNNTSLNPAITALTGDALRAYAEEMNAIALGHYECLCSDCGDSGDSTGESDGQCGDDCNA